MGRLSFLLLCLASVFAYNFGYSDETWGDISVELESVDLLDADVNTPLQQNFMKIVEENKDLRKFVQENDSLTKLVESQQRSLVQPRQAAASTTTITYRLGQRITGM